MTALQDGYAWLLGRLLKVGWLVIGLFVAGLVASLSLATNPFAQYKDFLPKLDDGRIGISLTAERGVNVEAMDQITRRVEDLIFDQPEIDTVFTIAGGRIFGRSQYEAPNSASIEVQLLPGGERRLSSRDWIARMNRLIENEQLVGVRIRLRERGIRGLRISRGDDEVAFRVKGAELEQLDRIGARMAEVLKDSPGLRNVRHSNEDVNQELSVRVDRERAADHGLNVEDVGRAVRYRPGRPGGDGLHQRRSQHRHRRASATGATSPTRPTSPR